MAGESEEHDLRPLAVSGTEDADISFGQRPTGPQPYTFSQGNITQREAETQGTTTSGTTFSSGAPDPKLAAAVLDTHSPARGLLKAAESDRLAKADQPKSLEFVKGGNLSLGEANI